MKRFNEDFKTKLYNIIEEIESESHVEIVSIIKAESGKYRDISVAWASIIMILSFSFMMFAPFEYNVYLIYFVSLFIFLVTYFSVELIHPLKFILIKKSRKKRQVEIMARAHFQKGGIRFTNTQIGTLLYVSLFEKQVYIIKDRGAETAIPEEENIKMQNEFDKIFEDSDVSNNFMETLRNTKTIFKEYIPQVENDINELPDNMEINL